MEEHSTRPDAVETVAISTPPIGSEERRVDSHRVALPESIESDMRRFLQDVQAEVVDLKTLGLGSRALDSVLSSIRGIYRLDSAPPASVETE